MIEMNTPCRDCTIRKLGCHSHCGKYEDYKKELQRIKDLKTQAKEMDRYISNGINTGRIHLYNK